VTETKDLDIVMVTGLSGAGRSTATRALEDLGWFVMDNLPSMLIPDAIEHVANRSPIRRVAVVADVRSGGMFDNFVGALDEIRSRGANLRLLFLEATDEALVRRFESSRRPHPLQEGGRILEGVVREREMLADLRASADLVIDTTSLSVHDLRRAVENAFADQDVIALRATVISFGFKNGIPVDADFVADVRFLPNPHWVEELRPLNGTDGPVNDYVVDLPEARDFLDQYASLLDIVSEGYLREGKRYVTIALGCTGGKHRSVAMAENLAVRLIRHGVEARVVHRDLGRE
jgi:RNase adapter protein RapZ